MPETDPDCLFCAIVAGTIDAQIIDQSEQAVAFMDINPATRGHVLVVPRVHCSDLYEISAGDLAETAALARQVALRIRDKLGADGVNLLNSCRPAAWQTVFHFHMHVIPRYEGDPLQLPWVPEAGDSDSIAACAAALRS
ncbi:MAG: HIT domain-containing protein [Actinobacteria bacterium]|uniref:Unannotated protein n=1 Tax=freshwater metagenome TaxID=449393 RepID=A0A6J5ZUI9_9ZZZZ|nr:HIT domain-containing protein [Actinomycetota bacterium]